MPPPFDPQARVSARPAREEPTGTRRPCPRIAPLVPVSITGLATCCASTHGVRLGRANRAATLNLPARKFDSRAPVNGSATIAAHGEP